MAGPPPYAHLSSASQSQDAASESKEGNVGTANDALRREYDRRDEELLQVREENQRLKLELAEKQATPDFNRLWIDHHLDRGSEVFSYSFAATSLSGANQGVRLYINQNNTMTELVYDGIMPDRFAIPQWDRGFVFPGPLMPDSAIAATNSYVSRDAIPDGADRGRDILRVFFFDPDGTLREWVRYDSVWRKSDLQIRGADPKNVSAICWSQGGFAEWSLFYITEGNHLCERKCYGGISGQWSRAAKISWSRSARIPNGKLAEQTTEQGDSLQSAFTVTTNHNGTDRKIFFLDPSSPDKFQTLKWGETKANTWSKVEYPKAQGILGHSWEGPIPSYSAFCMEGSFGIRLYFQHDDDVSEWMSWVEIEGGKWIRHTLRNVSSPGTMVATACQHLGRRFRQYIFSVSDDRIVQTTFAHGWHSRPMIIRNL